MPRRTKGQHFLLTAAARSLSLAKVLRMTEPAAEATFAAIRWEETQGRPVCPRCGCRACYDCRRPVGVPRWRCKACGADFSLTSGTLFAFRKLPIRTYLAAIVIFLNEVKGKSALALSRDLDVQYKTAFVLAHKIREAMASDMKGAAIGGAGRVVEIDGCHVGGHVRPENEKKDRLDRRLAGNRAGTRRVVVALRERGGRTLAMAFKTEAASIDFIRSRVDGVTVVHADEAADWNALHGRFDTKRINHQTAYSLDGACTNAAESLFSRLRRAEIGQSCNASILPNSGLAPPFGSMRHHHLSGPYLDRYARETAFREDHRRASNGEQFGIVVSLVAKSRPSVDFCGYWQRARAA